MLSLWFLGCNTEMVKLMPCIQWRFAVYLQYSTKYSLCQEGINCLESDSVASSLIPWGTGRVAVLLKKAPLDDMAKRVLRYLRFIFLSLHNFSHL